MGGAGIKTFSVGFAFSAVAQLLGFQCICCLAVPCKTACGGLPPFCLFHVVANHVRVVIWLYLLVSGCSEGMACGRDDVAGLI